MLGILSGIATTGCQSRAQFKLICGITTKEKEEEEVHFPNLKANAIQLKMNRSLNNTSSSEQSTANSKMSSSVENVFKWLDQARNNDLKIDGWWNSNYNKLRSLIMLAKWDTNRWSGVGSCEPSQLISTDQTNTPNVVPATFHLRGDNAK